MSTVVWDWWYLVYYESLVINNKFSFVNKWVYLFRHIQFLVRISLDVIASVLTYSTFRSNVSLVIGIPTVKRPKGSYITSTLQSIFENMNADESVRCLVVLFVGDTNARHVKETISTVQTLFRPQLQDGLLDVVAPNPSYYPDSSTYRYSDMIIIFRFDRWNR